MLKNELALTFESFENEESFHCAFQAIDSQWIEEALFATEKVSIRRRRLPAQQAVWLFIMMDQFYRGYKYHRLSSTKLCIVT